MGQLFTLTTMSSINLAKNLSKKFFWIMYYIRENRSFFLYSLRFLIIRVCIRICVRSRLCLFFFSFSLSEAFFSANSFSLSFFADEMELTSLEINLPHNLDEMPLICWLPEPKIENFPPVFFLFSNPAVLLATAVKNQIRHNEIYLEAIDNFGIILIILNTKNQVFSTVYRF